MPALELPLDEWTPPDDWGEPGLPDVDSAADPPIDWDWQPPLPNDRVAPPIPDRESLEAELAHLERRIEDGAIEMNTLDGMQRLERLEEDRDGVLSELMTHYPTPALLEANGTLVDARFMTQGELDTGGAISGYAVQAIALYEDMNDDLVGIVLDVGHYEDKEVAAETYTALQDSLTSNTITPKEVRSLAEALAEESGLDRHAWQKMTPEDLANYEYHRTALDTTSTPLPEQAALSNEQALAALNGIGLDAPPDFDLERDSFYDMEAGERVINGIFQVEPGDPMGNCRPLFIALMVGQDGPGFQAQAVEFGPTGSLAAAEREQAQVQMALEAGGVSQALETIADLDAPHVEPSSPMPEITLRSRDID